MARKMKDSGIEWIGLIPQAWAVQRVKNLADVYTGNSIKDDQKEFYEDPTEAIPYIATKDIDVTLQTIDFENGMYVKINDDSFKRAPSQSTLLCIEGGSAGKKIAFIEQDVCFVNKLCCLHSNTEFNKFLYYYFMSPAFTQLFNSYISGLIGGVSVKELCNFVITLPPFEEQEQIAMFLDLKCKHIDSVIEKTHAAIEEYKRLKQSVITQAVTKGICPNREMKDSGIEWIGEIPKEWVCEKFKYIARVKANLVHPDGYGDYQQVSPENIEKGTGKILPCKTVKETGVISDNHLFQKGQILYSKIRPILNKVAIAPFDGLCSADMYPIETDINKYYLLYALLSDSYLVNIRLITEDRVKMPKINQEELSNIFFAIPEESEQSEIVAYLDEKTAAIDSLIQKKEQLITELEAYKKSLIYEYVTGKKEIPT